MTYRMNSCEDGDLHLHSDDRASDKWVVEAVWPGKEEFVPCEHTPNEFFYGSYSVSRNSWYIEGCSRLRITDVAGRSTEHTVRSHPSIRTGKWDWPPRPCTPNHARTSAA